MYFSLHSKKTHFESNNVGNELSIRGFTHDRYNIFQTVEDKSKEREKRKNARNK